MTETLRPASPEQLEEALGWALGGGHTLEILGNGTKRGLGHGVAADAVLDLSGLGGLVFYEPEELVLRAHAGMAMSEVDALLKEKNQRLAFEPIDYGPVYGGKNAAGTIGGLVACNLSGPRRIRAGAARDNVLGFEGFSGRAEAFKSGGRVMKNVSGFDLSKLMAGSYGTLGVLHTVTLKTMPRDETIRTVLLLGATAEVAATAMTAATGSPHEVNAAAHLPAAQAAGSAVAAVASAGMSVTAIRVEGPDPSTKHRANGLCELLKPHGAVEIIEGGEADLLWAELRDVKPFQSRDGVLWRISVAPTDGAKLVGALSAKFAAEAVYDWAGGLVWLLLPECDADKAALIRAETDKLSGHATLIRASDALRAEVPVFHPEPGAIAVLSQRIRDAFDPKSILNPGRMRPMGASS